MSSPEPQTLASRRASMTLQEAHPNMYPRISYATFAPYLQSLEGIPDSDGDAPMSKHTTWWDEDVEEEAGVQGEEAEGGGGGGGGKGLASPATPTLPASLKAAIPEDFWSLDFSLKQPEQFRRLILAPTNVAHLAELHGYLDTVELELAQRVLARRRQFFGALSTLQGLEGAVNATLAGITTSRKQLGDAKGSVVSRVLRVLHKRRRRARLTKVRSLVDKIRDVVATVDTVKSLITTRQFMRALDLIARARRDIASRLSGVQCLNPVAARLSEFRRMIGDILAQELVANTMKLVTAGVPEGGMEEVKEYDLQGGAEGAQDSETVEETWLRLKIHPLIQGLVRVRVAAVLVSQYIALQVFLCFLFRGGVWWQIGRLAEALADLRKRTKKHLKEHVRIVSHHTDAYLRMAFSLQPSFGNRSN